MAPKATPGPKKNQHGAESPWHDICLSPTPTWTPAPGALHLAESDDEVSPTSTSPSSFSFFTPKQSKHQSFFSKSPVRQHGYLEDNGFRRKHKITNVLLMALFWTWGAREWCSLHEQSRDPLPVVPPPGSASGEARLAFAKLYERDWGAEPSLFVMLDASTSKRAKILREKRPYDSHSFTDDTSVAYEEGKHFCYELTQELEEKFQYNGDPSVRITSYYSLQEQGLDYVARHIVTPDGSKTVVEIEFLQNEMGTRGFKRLKQSILEFAEENQPSSLDIHFTGRTWNEPLDHDYAFVFSWIGFIFGMLGLFQQVTFGIKHLSLQRGFLISASMATTLSSSAVLLTHLVRIPFAPSTVSTLVFLSFVLSVYYSSLQLDQGYNRAKRVTATIARSGFVFISFFVAMFVCIPSPALKNMSAAAATLVVSSMCFHSFLVPTVSGCSEPIKNQRDVAPRPKILSIIALCATFVLLVVFQAVPKGFLGSAASSHFYTAGESMGHGQLTPFRILFDGHKRNASMVSLNGYDIVQMVVDELKGISLSATSDSEANEDPPELRSGSTHVGESFSEVQHLIKNLVHHLKRLREEQQRDFDLHHQRRQNHWKEQQHQEESDIEDFRCDYNVNKITTYTGIAMLENLRIPHSLFSAANICRGMKPRCPSEALHLLNVLEDETTTSDHLATFVTVNLAVDPFSRDGNKWLSLARETIERLQADPRILGGVEVYIGGPAAEYHDSQRDQSEKLPQRLVIVVGVTMLALAISFGSWMTSLRAKADNITSQCQKPGQGTSDGCDWERQNQACLAKFEELMKSPQAP